MPEVIRDRGVTEDEFEFVQRTAWISGGLANPATAGLTPARELQANGSNASEWAEPGGKESSGKRIWGGGQSYPWLSLRATRSSRSGSGRRAGACRRIRRGCIRGWEGAVAGGCAESCGSRG
jgi:hypothetical protein